MEASNITEQDRQRLLTTVRACIEQFRFMRESGSDVEASFYVLVEAGGIVRNGHELEAASLDKMRAALAVAFNHLPRGHECDGLRAAVQREALLFYGVTL